METELDGPTHRVADLDALHFARMSGTGTVKPAYMVVIHESLAGALLAALEEGAEYLPASRIAIAYDNADTACAQFAGICEALLARHVSLLPMNTNVTNWVRLLQVIQSGGQYVPPELLQTQAAVPAGLPAEVDAGAQPVSEAHTQNQTHAQPARGAVIRRPEGRGRPAPSPSPVAPETGAAVVRGQERLTPRETEVLEMAAEGRPNKTIAGALDLSEHTVKLYMHRIIGKLGVRNRTEAAVWYHQNGGHA